MDAIEAAEKVSSTLSSLVPQLFFDIIARFIPGFIIIWSLYMALYGCTIVDVSSLRIELLHLLPSNDFFVFCITTVIFYTTSIVFFGVWSFFICVFRPILLRVDSFIEPKADSGESDQSSRIEVNHEFAFRHDYIKLRAPAAGNRITKLRAEMHMSGALAATFFLCLVISIIGGPYSTLSGAALVARALLYFLGLIGLIFANMHFNRRLESAVVSYSTLLGYNSAKYTFPSDIIRFTRHV